MTNKYCIIHCFYMYHEKQFKPGTRDNLSTRDMLKQTEAEKIMQPFLTKLSSRRQVLRYLQEGSNYTDGIHAKYCNQKTQRNTFCLANNSGAREGGTHSHWLFTICMGKPVGPRFRQMVHKFRTGKFRSSRNRVYHLCKSVPFTGKRPRRPETGIKDGLEEMEGEFWLGIFRPKKKSITFSDVPLLPDIFRWNDPKKACSIYLPTGFS